VPFCLGATAGVTFCLGATAGVTVFIGAVFVGVGVVISVPFCIGATLVTLVGDVARRRTGRGVGS